MQKLAFEMALKTFKKVSKTTFGLLPVFAMQSLSNAYEPSIE
jgi:hypothetical protein